MGAETRYFRSDKHTINGLLAFKLLTTNSADTNTLGKSKSNGFYDVKWGIRVWKRDLGGSETEITSGTPVAQVTRTADGEGVQSATYTPGETVLVATDAIVVRIYCKIGADAWGKLSDWITDQLGTTILNAEEWTVYYYTIRDTEVAGFPPVLYTYGDFQHGNVAPRNSRIEGFTWGVAVVVKRTVGDGLTCVVS